jgi:hypothetical protein
MGVEVRKGIRVEGRGLEGVPAPVHEARRKK